MDLPVPVRRLAIDGSYATPLDQQKRGSHFYSTMPYVMSLPRGSKARINSLSFSHEQTRVLDSNHNTVFIQEARTHKDGFGRTILEFPITHSFTLATGHYTSSTLRDGLQAKLR